MKTYKYTVNNTVSTGTYYVQAENKKQAIEIACSKWRDGVNTSSFRVAK